MLDFFRELTRRNKALYYFGWLLIACFVSNVVLFGLDDTVIKGINAWIKPMKFALSIAIYSWTFGWLLAYAQHPVAKRVITTGLIVTMTVEYVLIFLQAWRGTESHFNIYTALDGIIFGVMGVFILINTLINFYALGIFLWGKTTITGSTLFVWQCGLALFFLGGISGGWMVQQLSHTVGAVDGGPGLPFVNWSTVAGDIRAAHFATLHGLQILPLAGAALHRYKPTTSGQRIRLVVVVYVLLCLYLHILAWMGLPLLAIR